MKNFKLDDRLSAKGGIISLSIFTLIGISLLFWSFIYYNEYSEIVTTIRGRTRTIGLAPTIFGWTIFGIPLALIGIFILSKTRNFKAIGLKFDENNAFINKDGIRNSTIPYRNIKSIEEDEHLIYLKLYNYDQLIANQFWLFRRRTKRKFVIKESPISISKIDFKDESKELAEFLIEKVKI